MNPKHLTLLAMFLLIASAAAYLLFLSYALMQLKTARETGMARINEILDGIKDDDKRADNSA